MSDQSNSLAPGDRVVIAACILEDTIYKAMAASCDIPEPDADTMDSRSDNTNENKWWPW
jgi:hypothetical protein